MNKELSTGSSKKQIVDTFYSHVVSMVETSGVKVEKSILVSAKIAVVDFMSKNALNVNETRSLAYQVLQRIALGISLDPQAKQAWVVRFGKSISIINGYHFYVLMLKRNGYTDIGVHFFDGDDDVSCNNEGTFFNIKPGKEVDASSAIGAFVRYQHLGKDKTSLIYGKKIWLRAKSNSKSHKSGKSHSSFDPWTMHPLTMMAKSVLKEFCRMRAILVPEELIKVNQVISNELQEKPIIDDDEENIIDAEMPLQTPKHIEQGESR